MTFYKQQEKILLEELTAQLTVLGEKLPAKGKEDILFDRLNKRRQDYHGYQFRAKTLQQELHALIEQQTSNREKVGVSQQKLEELKAQLQTEDITGLQLSLQEKKIQLQAANKSFAEREEELEQIKSSLQ